MENLTVNAVVENLDEVVGFVFKRLSHYGCSKKTLMQIRLAVEEIFVNISSYAYDPSVGPAEVRCEVLQDPLRVVIQFLDGGRPFDPLAKDDADTSADALFSREGGLGILLVKETMDGVHYSYENGKNVLTIEKRLTDTEDVCL
ncbi:MAG: ATP-binding protein [Firmicutes bacterium]|nr:ATP-binding protein [Bacillota bacterium]